MNGYFNSHNEPAVRLDVGSLSVEVLIDTGFNGSLIIPGYIADNLDLVFEAHQDFFSVTGTVFFASACSTEIDWLGKKLKVAVASCGEVNEALLGNHLLRGCRLTIDYGFRTVTIVESQNT
jgi:clan AA aspartic protease